MRRHRNKFITAEATSIDDFIARFEILAEQFRAWKAAGVVYQEGAADDYAVFTVPDGVELPDFKRSA